MSYLMVPRLAFAGRFLADVSTINNQGGDDGWNAQGGAAFEFLDCRVTGVELRDAGANPDPALGFAVAGRPDGSSAKMVDLDPDWQMSSEIWALWVRLFDPSDGALAVTGRFTVAPFRDLWLRQGREVVEQRGPANGMPMGGRFVSTLRDVAWGPAAARSPALVALREVSSGALSVGLHQMGFFYATTDPRWRTGTLIGTIGAHLPGDAETAVVARRLQGVPLPNAPPGPPLTALGPLDVEVSADEQTLSMDLGHALPIDNADGDITDLGAWPALPQLAGCTTLVLAPVVAGFAQWGPVAAINPILEATPSGQGWYAATGGVISTRLSAAQAATIRQAPLALYGRLRSGALVAITEETAEGIFVRADAFVLRMEPGEPARATLLARRYGRAAAGMTIYLTPSPLQNSVPPILSFPATVTTDDAGRASVPLSATDPGTPRTATAGNPPYPDGQVYPLDYSPLPPSAGVAVKTATGLGQLDVIVAHVRAAYPIPAEPTWEDHVQPILADYAVTYPIMSKHLFDIGDYDAVVLHRQAMRLAFSRDIEDSNYMPVTRDLSAGKRDTIIKWLAAETGDPAAPLRRRGTSAPSPEPKSLDAYVDRAPDFEDDAKTRAGERFDPIAPEGEPKP